VRVWADRKKKLFACVRTHFFDIAYAAYDTANECGSWPLQRVGPLLYVPPSARCTGQRSCGDRVGSWDDRARLAWPWRNVQFIEASRAWRYGIYKHLEATLNTTIPGTDTYWPSHATTLTRNIPKACECARDDCTKCWWYWREPTLPHDPPCLSRCANGA
jgi:hypothetical protein